MLPTPTMPSVLPPSSSLRASRRARHSPSRVQPSTWTARFAHISMSISACSATAGAFAPGAWTTATPSRVAAGMSTMSRPAPWRPTTRSRGQAAMSGPVHSGLERKRMPCASCASRITASSVSSAATTTCASFARTASASGGLIVSGEHDDRSGISRTWPAIIAPGFARSARQYWVRCTGDSLRARITPPSEFASELSNVWNQGEPPLRTSALNAAAQRAESGTLPRTPSARTACSTLGCHDLNRVETGEHHEIPWQFR